VKVVFLDVDGVMVNHRSWYVRQPGQPASADPACVQALNRITDLTGARLVLSSSWRVDEKHAWLVELLRRWGVTGKLIGETPRLHDRIRGIYVGKRRGEEIAAWLKGAPEVEAFVILDDDADMAPFLDRLVKTQFDDGLTEADANRAIALLNAPVPRRSRPSVNKFDTVM